MQNNSSKQWAVIGGGMLGMTLAHRLAQNGQRVTLLEAGGQLGGLASAWQLGDVVWDRHYHVTLLSDTNLRSLLAEIGLESEMQWVETKTGFYSQGRLHSMSNAMEFLTFPPLSLWERLRLGASIFYISRLKDWQRLEQVPVGDWLRRVSGESVYRKIWLPLLQAKLGEAYLKTSAAFIWAHVNRMYKARRTGMKREMFGYVPGGYARVLDTLADVLVDEGVEVRCGAAVKAVENDADQRVKVSLADGDELQFDRVIFTTPSSVIAGCCPGLTAEERARFQGVDYLGIVCTSLLLKRPISKYYVTNITDEWVPLTAVIEMTTIVDPAELGGRHLVYLPKYMPAESEGFAATDAEVEQTAIETLEKMYPDFSRDDVLACRVSRARQVMALPTIDYSRHLPPMQTSIPGVYAINSAHILKGNLNVNETIQIAEEAIQGVLAKDLRPVPFDNQEEATEDVRDEQTTRQLVARP